MKADAKPVKPLRKPNPIYKYMGLGENFRPKLPSRNWSIFLAITGSFTAAVIYDKREKKRAQRKWCKLVEHVAKEPLDPRAMPRRLTIFLEAPPTDGLRVAQDHFKEYVKPILVASGLDWEFIQGRKEGDIRAEVAEKIRTSRLPPHLRTGEDDPIARTRASQGVKEFDGPAGDIIIGRHTWKEYVRGLHEGWLGPLTEPPRAEPEAPQLEEKKSEIPETLPGITIHESQGQTEVPPETPKKEDEKRMKPLPFILTSEYSGAEEPTDIPIFFDPSQPIAFPHILGFLNTPTRLVRFLNRRNLADEIGRNTAAIILSSFRPYDITSTPQDSSPISEVVSQSEQESILIEEERDWHKATRVRVDGEPERTWLDSMVLDPRIARRMRKAELTPEEEERAKTIVVPEEEIEGWIKGGIRSAWRNGMSYLGFGKKPQEKAESAEEILE